MILLSYIKTKSVSQDSKRQYNSCVGNHVVHLHPTVEPAAVKLTAQKKLIMLLERHHFISVPFVPHLLFHITGGMWICAQMCFSAFIIIKFFWCCPVLPNLLACICMLWVLPLKGTFSEDNLRRNKIKLNQKKESDHQNSISKSINNWSSTVSPQSWALYLPIQPLLLTLYLLKIHVVSSQLPAIYIQ